MKKEIFAERELEVLWPFYLENISYLFTIGPIFFVPYFISIGLSLTQMGILLAVPSLTMLLFEIPTGAIADLYGRKFSVLLGYLLEGFLLISVLFSSSYYYLLTIFALMGISTSFSSGSGDAWVVDLIKSKKGKFLHNYFMKRRSIRSFVLIFSGIIGTLIVKKFGLILIWPISGLSCFIGFIILLFGEEKYAKRKVKISKSIRGLKIQTKTSLSYAKNHPVLFYLLVAGFIMAFAGAFSTGISWIPFLQGLNFPDYAFGYMWSAIWLVSAIAPLLSKKLMKDSGERNFIIKMTLIGALFLLLIYFATTWAFALGVLLVSVFFFEIQTPVSNIYFHKFIPDKLRATIGSLESMVFSLAGTIALPIAGYLADTIGARYVIILSGILTIPGILLYLKIKEK
ncbi:MAG: MFS transporter [Nanoarchaeota archaeon]|nr:MFS transporter [Nanoarchaeota archaeon]